MLVAEFRGGNQRQTASFTDSPARRKETDHQYFENNYFDDLQPMTLTFDGWSLTISNISYIPMFS